MILFNKLFSIDRIYLKSIFLIVTAVSCLAAALANGQSYVPNRVYDTHHRRFIDFESMLASASTADVLFLGERHDDPGTHRLEAAALEGLARRRGNLVLALEMFERDVQPLLDNYLSGRASETDFLAGSRPWPAYAADYRAMVELARTSQWPVIAGGVPRRLASLVSRRGLKVILDSISATDRGFTAHDVICPRDDYFARFAKTMADMPSHSGDSTKESAAEKAATIERVYQAQCIKDETMGESVAKAYTAAPPGALVVHVNGAFHSDYGLGTVERVKRRLTGKRVAVVSFVPVKDLDKVDERPDHTLADFIVFTLAPPAK